jgi:hypothetical protein
MKKVLILVLSIFLIGFIGAATWDDRVNYDEQKREYTITNTFGLGSEIGKIRLNTPQYHKVAVGYNKVAEITLTNGGDWEEVLEGIELFYINDDESYTEFNRQIDYKLQVPYDKPIYETQCQEQNLNGTPTNINCKEVQIGTRPSTKWIEFNNTLKENQKVTLGLFTDVQIGDRVEWIPIMYGHHLDEWASWTASLEVGLLAYWELEELSGDAEDSFGTFDGTINTSIGYGAAGKIKNAYDFNRAGKDYINLGNNINLTDSHNFSIQAWVYPNFTSLGGEIIFALGDGPAGNQGVKLYFTSNGDLYFGSGGGLIGNNTDYILNQTWSHIIAIYTTNGTSYIYLNGSRIDTTGSVGNLDATIYNTTIGANDGISAMEAYFSGIIDEVAVWNRSLTASEVTDLWNSGTGIEFQEEGPDVDLLSPANATETTNNSVIFICNVTSGASITNVSLIIDNVINETNISGVNNTNYIFPKSLNYARYEWTCESCNTNLACGNATEFSLSIAPFIINSETYSNSTIEGNIEDFLINITLASGFQVSTANLIWNNTAYAGTLDTTNDPTIIITRELVIPSVTSDTNITFFWNITTDDGTSSQSSEHNQTVQALTINNCTINSVVFLNLTMVDEEFQNVLNGTTDNTTIEIDVTISSLDQTSEVAKYSNSFNETNPAGICLNINLSNGIEYSYDATIRYEADDYANEYYNIQQGTLSNATIPENITLFDLLGEDSTEFQITFKDSNFVAVEDALIQISRQYVSEGIFKTIEIPKTDSNG